MRHLSLNYVFKFGKFKGMTLEDAIKDDHKVIRWYIDNLEWFVMDNEAYKFYVATIKNHFGYVPEK